MARGPQRRIATVDCAVVNRFIMLSPIEMPLRACVDQASDRDFGITNCLHHPRQFAHGLSERSGGESLIYDSLHRKKGGSRLKLGTKRTWRYVRVVESGMRSG